MKRFPKAILIALLLTLGATCAQAADISISAATVSGFAPGNLPASVSVTASVTNGSTTVTSSAAFKSSWVGLSGFRISLGGTDYTVSSVASTSSLTISTAYAGATGSVTATVYPFVLLRFYSSKAWITSDSQIIQAGTPDSGAWYRQYACSVISSTLYIPAVTLPSTADALSVQDRNARWMARIYHASGGFIQAYGCFENFALAASPTSTTWAALCQANRPVGSIVQSTAAYTAAESDARYLTASSASTLYVPQSLADAAGDVVYASAADTFAKLAGNTSTDGKVLTSTGNGSVSAAPTFSLPFASTVTRSASSITWPSGASASNIALLTDTRFSRTAPLGMRIKNSLGFWQEAGPMCTDARAFGVLGDGNDGSADETDELQAALDYTMDSNYYQGPGGKYGCVDLGGAFVRILKPLKIKSHQNNDIPFHTNILIRGNGPTRAVISAQGSVTTLTGTVSLTGTALAGTGTTFTTQLVVGDIIQIGSDPGQLYQIATITNNTTATTVKAAHPANLAGQTAYLPNHAIVADHSQLNKITLAIQDVGFFGKGVYNATVPQAAIMAFSTSNADDIWTALRVDRSRFSNFNYGIYGNNIESSSITNSHFISNSIAHIRLQELDPNTTDKQPNANVIANNLMESLSASSTNGLANVYLYKAFGTLVSGNTIQGGYGGSATGHGIYAYDCDGCTFENNWMELGITTGFNLFLESSDGVNVVGHHSGGLAAGDVKTVASRSVNILGGQFTNAVPHITADAASYGIQFLGSYLRHPQYVFATDSSNDGVQVDRATRYHEFISSAENYSIGTSRNQAGDYTTNWATNPRFQDDETGWTTTGTDYYTRTTTGSGAFQTYLLVNTQGAGDAGNSGEQLAQSISVPDEVPAGPVTIAWDHQIEHAGTTPSSSRFVDIRSNISANFFRINAGASYTTGTWYRAYFQGFLAAGTGRTITIAITPTLGPNSPRVRFTNFAVYRGYSKNSSVETLWAEERTNTLRSGFFLNFPTGSAATPTLRHVTGTTTGINFSSTTVAASVSGTERFQVNSTGTAVIGNQTTSGSLTIGGGTAIAKVLSATAALDFGAVAANTCSDLTVTVTGAASGNVVSLGIPAALGATAGLEFTGFVSASDTVTVRACNVTTGASADPASATVRVQVTQF